MHNTNDNIEINSTNSTNSNTSLSNFLNDKIFKNLFINSSNNSDKIKNVEIEYDSINDSDNNFDSDYDYDYDSDSYTISKDVKMNNDYKYSNIINSGLLNFVLGNHNIITFNKQITYGSFNYSHSKKILLENIIFILDVGEEELIYNFEKYKSEFTKLKSFVNKNYILDNDDINILLKFEMLIFNLVKKNLISIKYYLNFISNLPNKFISLYGFRLHIKKNEKINYLQSKYPIETKKIINLIVDVNNSNY